MSQQTVATLALIALLLPTGGAILARLIGKIFGDRATQIIGGASCVVALGSVALLSEVEIDRVALGPLAIFVPASGPLLDAEAFTLRRQDEMIAVAEPEQVPVEVAAEPPEAPPLTTAEPTRERATQIPRATATPSPEATAEPTSTPQPSPPAPDEPSPTPTAEPTPEPTTEPTAIAASDPETDARTYTVEPGDTLRGIAESFNVSVEALIEANDLTAEEADALRIGLTLTIPASGPPAAEAEEPASPPRTEVVAYIVEPGDTLRSIAAQFDVSVERLLEFNGLSAEEADSLPIDLKLYIPVQ